jgi:hypothetical protein
MRNSYADTEVPASEVLHGAARLHVALGRMDGAGIATRGWSYNELVSGVLRLAADSDGPEVYLHRCLDTLLDTLDDITEIGPGAVQYLHDLAKIK